MATETVTTESPSGHSHGRTIIAVAVVVSVVGAGVIVFGTFLWIRSRRHSNHVRLSDEENQNEEPIPLQDLPPAEDRETTHGE